MEQLKKYLLQQTATQQLPAEEALLYLEELDAMKQASNHVEYAVIGMSCRFPGALTPEAFWGNLLEEKDAVGAFPKQRIDDIRYANERSFEQCKGLHCRIGTYFDQIDLFDHTFFKLTPAEARVMDPNQRIFLETAIE
ncbi:MAG TPA: beta-ketoacyl synthase N-terminal-like domain-containing protein, partial [Chlamydiales bacterium]|nr:beta-ketoacyl synthase N-terminal-like domain-containing protein [Chlamydiales bacterium]